MTRTLQFPAAAVLAALLKPGVAAAAGDATASPMQSLVAEAHQRTADSWQQLQALPAELFDNSSRWLTAWQSGDGLRAVTYALILLLIGSGVEWLYWCYAGCARQAIAEAAFADDVEAASSPHRAASLAVRRALLEACGALLFAITAIASSAGFSWPAAVHQAVLGVALTVGAIRLAGIVSRALLSLANPRRRLLPVGDRAARRLRGDAVAAAGIASGGTSLYALFANALGAPALAYATSIAAGAAVCGVAFDAIRLWPTPPPAQDRRRSLATAAAILPFLLAVSVLAGFACVLFGALQAAWSIAILLLAFLTQRILSGLIETFAAVPESEADASIAAYRPVLHRIAAFAAIGLGLAALALEWGLSPTDPWHSPGPLGRVLGRALDITLVVLLADLVWLWARSLIDRRIAAVAGSTSGGADPGTRLQTLLSLLRKTMLVIIIVTASLISLSAIGIDIAPLLAGAGVIGIAIGLGAQALVRDIVSGIFYLLEDAFRIGEYVEFGQIRGTVERISLRFLRLRHHRGGVHTIPFGEIRWLTNQSRDWQIIKLDFRVPFSTDLQLVKRLVRDVGDELLRDEELGPSLIEPLKSRGVVRMEEFSMVIAVKFTARPGDGMFLVRRAAYQKILEIFATNGIRFADRHVKVEFLPGKMGEALLSALSGGAAEMAIEPVPELLPVPERP